MYIHLIYLLTGRTDAYMYIDINACFKLGQSGKKIYQPSDFPISLCGLYLIMTCNSVAMELFVFHRNIRKYM